MKAALAFLVATACGTTGGNAITFDVAAAGPADATGGPRILDTALGWHVSLERARVHIGAVYLNLANPISGSQGTECILPGIYTAEELSPLDVDVLSPALQPFPAPATGTDDRAKTGEVWLTGGDVNAFDDPTIIGDICGTASKDASTVAFVATITIGSKRVIQSSDPAQPSAHPVCKLRIVTPIPIDLAPSAGATLVVRLDPALWFANVDFATLPPIRVAHAGCPAAAAEFPDDNSLPASQNLFTGMRAASGSFQFSIQ